jgi:hypothetical protein
MLKGFDNNTVQGVVDLGGGLHAAAVIETGSAADVAGFSAVGASVLDPFFVQPPLVGGPIVGAGVTFNQAAGSINILSGTTPRSEFLARSVKSYKGFMRLRFSAILSQRIANSNFAILLADLIGEGLAYNIISPTLVDVEIPAHGFTAANVGQSLLAGGVTGAAGFAGRYQIAAIQSETTIRLTVAGWPANGTGTLTLFGRNYIRNLFTGVTATNVAFDAQRNGWATGDTTATINTTASPGTVIANEITGRDVWLSDSLRASTATPNFTTRASRYENIPEDSTKLYVFLWCFNGTAAPATSTTLTVGHIAVEEFSGASVYVQGQRAQGATNPAPVAVQGLVGLSALPAGSNLIGGVTGAAAHDAVIAGNPSRVGGRALTANYTAVASGDTADFISTLVGAQVTRANSIPELEWQSVLTIVNTTSTAIQAAAGAGLKRYQTNLTYQNTNAVATLFNLLRGTTVIGTFSAPANMPNPVPIPYVTPLQTAANEALNVQAVTTGANLIINAQGYTAP